MRQNEADLIKRALGRITKQELMQFIMQKIDVGNATAIPVSLFTTTLSPLEALSRYLVGKGMSISEIARVLRRRMSSISLAYRHSLSKNFTLKKSQLFVPLSEFHDHPELSVMEVVVRHLEHDLRCSRIAQLLKRSPKTIWTFSHRVRTKTTLLWKKHNS